MRKTNDGDKAKLAKNEKNAKTISRKSMQEVQ